MSSRKKQPAAAADEGDIDTSFNPNKVAMAIHYYYTSREKVTWREAQKKFKVCSKHSIDTNRCGLHCESISYQRLLN
jgi:hypothetical protein